MKCKHCGAELQEQELVCKACGTDNAKAEENTVETVSDAVENKAEEAKDAAADKVEEIKDAAADKVEEIKDTAADKVEEIKDAAADKVEEIKDTAADKVEEIKDAAADKVEEAREMVESTMGEVREAVQEKKKPNKVVIGAVAAAAVVALGVFGITKMMEKDPRQVVIEAFENVYSEDQVSPVDELLGFSAFSENAGKTSAEGSMTLRLDSCSEESVNAYAGAGLRIGGRNDVESKKSSAEFTAIYNGMDLASLDIYYGDDMLKAALPELSEKVFALDISEGLGARLADSPLVGPALAQQNVDVEGVASYLEEVIAQAEEIQEAGSDPYGMKELWNRYKEGCKAQENFKAALTVKKAEKGSYTMDGKEVSCKGYQVLVSKASMMDFLRTSSEFFLQDEELKNRFLKQLEMTVKMSELMGTSAEMGMQSAEELQKQSYEEAQKAVNEMLDTLDKVLDDVNMTVYVDSKGRLAAMEGTTVLHNETDMEDTIKADFHVELSGGAYLTQNAKVNVILSNPEDAADSITLDLVKQGTYDGKNLTADWSFDMSIQPENNTYHITYTGSYLEGGAYHMALEIGDAGSSIARASASGVVDSLEKGTSIHVTMDELELSAMDESLSLVLSGDYELKPLEGEIAEPEGTEMDVLAATMEDWQNVMMEMIYGVMGVAQQLGM